MNKYCLLLILLLFANCITANAQSAREGYFTLTGKVEGRDTGKLILQYLNNSKKYIQDTAWLKQGAFNFKGYVAGPTYARLIGDIKSFSIDEPNMGDMFLEPGNMTARLTENNFKRPVITGSVTQRNYDTVNNKILAIYAELKPFDLEYSRLKKAYAAGDKSKAMMDSLNVMQRKTVPYLTRRDNVYYTYIRNHPDSYLSAGILARFVLLRKMGLDSAQKYYDNLTLRVRSSALGMDFYESLNTERKVEQAALPGGIGAVGSMAQGFNVPDVDNKPLALSSFKNKKYVLLDFWATWCGPCMAMIPRIKELYRQYHTKGLEVISISWDYNEKNWKAGVQKEGLNLWYNIYAGQDKSAELTRKYGLQVIPTTILIDKEGLIVGRYSGMNSGTDDLSKKLSEIFK